MCFHHSYPKRHPLPLDCWKDMTIWESCSPKLKHLNSLPIEDTMCVGYDYQKTYQQDDPTPSKNCFQYILDQTPHIGLFIMGYRLQHSFNPTLQKITELLNHTFICFPLDVTYL